MARGGGRGARGTQDFTDIRERIVRNARAAAWRTLQEEARRVAADMAARAPHGDGTLAQSVRIEEIPAKLKIIIRAGGPSTTRRVRAGQKATYDYAMAQEFGTQDQPANPFFWPTYRAAKPRVRANVKAAIKRAIEQTR